MLTFQEMIFQLTRFWAEQGCLVHQGYDLEVGAGTFNPATFLRCLGPEPYSAVYVEPSRRPKDGRYGENPNRVQFYHQMQVIMKPSPENIQELYLKSLEAVGLDLTQHDIRFVHDDWENPTIGAWGLGWEVWADGTEISQFTYFQAVGGIPVNPVSGEITYGLERLALYIQNVDSFFDLKWNEEVYYGEIYKRSEWEWSHYNFTEANPQMWLRHFEDFEAESKRLVANHLPIPAYDFVMKASHAFNMLDARGVISVTERATYMARIRNLARILAESYIKSREEQQFPLLRSQKSSTPLDVPPPSTFCDPDEREDFLLEIGSEELPATFVPIGIRNLARDVEQLLKNAAIPFDSIKSYGTPRRLGVLVQGLVGGTHTVSEEKKGPPLKAVFDEKGMLTQAGAGFLRSCRLEDNMTRDHLPKEIEIRQIKGVDYLFATINRPGVSTRGHLAQLLAPLIVKLDFPKKMRWGTQTIEYARPLRWIVALYAKEVIPFAVGSVISGNQSRGHRVLSDEPVTFAHAGDYLDTLRKHAVLADVEERKQMILDQIATIELHLKGKVVAKERVMAQVLHLVEMPFVATTTFVKSFLAAPKEVLISEMVEHQKYFPIADEKGNLLPHFAIVCNNKPSELIKSGNQKALFPRLADGVFLYEEDLKTSLDTFADKLKSVTYQKELGSLWQKVERIKALAELIHSYLPLCDEKILARAAALCKADLASELVGEFPELQGSVGRIYAEKGHEPPEVAQAIDEHWMPRGEKAPLPTSPSGLILSIADKIDNLLSCYATNRKPTSSSDPYALRRQAIGILKMLIENQHHLPLPKLFEEAFLIFLQNPEISAEERKKWEAQQEALIQEIFHFLTNRLRSIFVEIGYPKKCVAAVLEQGLNDPYDLFKKLEALHKLPKTALDSLQEIYTRTKKILLSQNKELLPQWRLKKTTPHNRFPPVEPALFQEKQEVALFEKLNALKTQLHTQHLDRRLPEKRNYPAALNLLTELQPPLTAFFDDVKVVADEEKIRINRLALLQSVWDLLEEICAFDRL